MAYLRQLGVFGIWGACYFLAVGCGDDPAKNSAAGDAGEGGESNGSAGKTNSGGSLDNGGKAGMNAGGKAGNGGSGSSGDAGNGSSGDTGDGGTGAAGEGAGGGEGGMSSTAGAGGEGGAPGPTALQCVYQCEVDDDCHHVDAPPESCDQATHLCYDPSKACEMDADCVPVMSQWGGTCDDDSDCFDGFEVCVQWQGVGRCGTLPDPDFGCMFSVGEAIDLPRVGAQGEASVCATSDPRCYEGACDYGCGEPFTGGCGFGDGDTCSAETGHCECADGDECDSGTCGADGRCVECVVDDDCAQFANAGLDTCVSGKCGCASLDSCPAGGYTGAVKACQ